MEVKVGHSQAGNDRLIKGAAWGTSGADRLRDLELLFLRFTGGSPLMSGRMFAKMARECCILTSCCTLGDIDLIFAAVKDGPSFRKITFNEFCKALLLCAGRRGQPVDQLETSILIAAAQRHMERESREADMSEGTTRLHQGPNPVPSRPSSARSRLRSEDVKNLTSQGNIETIANKQMASVFSHFTESSAFMDGRMFAKFVKDCNLLSGQPRSDVDLLFTLLLSKQQNSKPIRKINYLLWLEAIVYIAQKRKEDYAQTERKVLSCIEPKLDSSDLASPLSSAQQSISAKLQAFSFDGLASGSPSRDQASSPSPRFLAPSSPSAAIRISHGRNFFGARTDDERKSPSRPRTATQRQPLPPQPIIELERERAFTPSPLLPSDHRALLHKGLPSRVKRAASARSHSMKKQGSHLTDAPRQKSRYSAEPPRQRCSVSPTRPATATLLARPLTRELLAAGTDQYWASSKPTGAVIARAASAPPGKTRVVFAPSRMQARSPAETAKVWGEMGMFRAVFDQLGAADGRLGRAGFSAFAAGCGLVDAKCSSEDVEAAFESALTEPDDLQGVSYLQFLEALLVVADLRNEPMAMLWQAVGTWQARSSVDVAHVAAETRAHAAPQPGTGTGCPKSIEKGLDPSEPAHDEDASPETPSKLVVTKEPHRPTAETAGSEDAVTAEGVSVKGVARLSSEDAREGAGGTASKRGWVLGRSSSAMTLAPQGLTAELTKPNGSERKLVRWSTDKTLHFSRQQEESPTRRGRRLQFNDASGDVYHKRIRAFRTRHELQRKAEQVSVQAAGWVLMPGETPPDQTRDMHRKNLLPPVWLVDETLRQIRRVLSWCFDSPAEAFDFFDVGRHLSVSLSLLMRGFHRLNIHELWRCPHPDCTRFLCPLPDDAEQHSYVLLDERMCVCIFRAAHAADHTLTKEEFERLFAFAPSEPRPRLPTCVDVVASSAQSPDMLRRLEARAEDGGVRAKTHLRRQRTIDRGRDYGVREDWKRYARWLGGGNAWLLLDKQLGELQAEIEHRKATFAETCELLERMKWREADGKRHHNTARVRGLERRLQAVTHKVKQKENHVLATLERYALHLILPPPLQELSGKEILPLAPDLNNLQAVFLDLLDALVTLSPEQQGELLRRGENTEGNIPFDVEEPPLDEDEESGSEGSEGSEGSDTMSVLSDQPEGQQPKSES